MTEKRFKLIKCTIGGFGLWDRTDGYVYGLTPNLENLVNSLVDKNEQLKQEKDELFLFFMEHYDQMEDELIEIWIKLGERIKELDKENEQLKVQLKEETDRVIKLEQYVYTKLCPESPNYDEEVLSEILNAILGDVE